MKVEVSTGELIDKITILQIKKEKFTDNKKLKNVENELEELMNSVSVYLLEMVEDEMKELKRINEEIWDIEDSLRRMEKNKTFDDLFIATARNVYFTNDRRAIVKKLINTKTGSFLFEEKEYVEY